MPNPSVRFEAAPGVLTTEVASETVLLNMANERYFGLDDIGTRCWQLLTKHGDVAIVVLRLAAEFEADPATIRKDVTALIDRLTAAGLVRVVS